MLESISTGELLLIIGMAAFLCFIVGRTLFRPRVDTERGDALVYDPKIIKSLSNARKEKYASNQEICGVLVAPGEEVEALDSQLDMLDNICESEGEFQAGVEQLAYFIDPAKSQLEKLCSDQANGDDYFSDEELEELIEEAEVAIAKAEWMVANPQDALAQWKEER